MSARLSTGLPRACSGAMYAAVPRIMPASVAAITIVGECERFWGTVFPDSGETIFANPKSSTLTVPSRLILMLPGLRSRWTMPFSCAASSASAICRAMASASVTRSGPVVKRSASVGPSTNSRTSAGPASDVLQAIDRRDVRMIQRREHARFPFEPRETIGITRQRVRHTLMATSRPNLLSRARTFPHTTRAHQINHAVPSKFTADHGGTVRCGVTLSHQFQCRRLEKSTGISFILQE